MNKKYILGIIFVIFGYCSIATKFFGLADFTIRKTTTLFISRIEFWVLLFLIFLYAKFAEKTNFLLIEEQRKKWWFYPLAICLTILITTIVMNIIVLIEHQFGMSHNTMAEDKLYEILCGNIGLLFLTCITASVTEELLFRGYLLPRIRNLSDSNWVAIIVSALLFGMAHFQYGDFNRMFFPFIIGLIFGSFYLKYKNISILIFCHFAMDFYSLYSNCK